jgi:hypothetical protein
VQDRPTAAEILATVGEYLQQDVLPVVDGSLRYQTLVAANLITLLGRELDAGDGPARREYAELTALIDTATDSDSEQPVSAGLDELNAALQARLLAEELPDPQFLRRARDVLERAVRDKLAVNKPGYDRYDMAVEVA